MILDALELADGSVLEFDVCVIGAGPAGITLARELQDQELRVGLVESGGTQLEPDTQDLSRLGTSDAYPRLEDRRRQFGGGANLWGGVGFGHGRRVRYLPLGAIDFEKRDWLSYSGWPFSRTDLDPYYVRAHALCGIGPYSYDIADHETCKARPLPVDAERFTTTVEWFGRPEVFSEEALAALRPHSNVTVVLHANACELVEREASPSVEFLRFECLNGHSHTVKAKVFVLAAGGIENPRILLLSNGRRAAGLGNQNDLVGRFFMDHWRHDEELLFEPTDPHLFERVRLYDIRRLESGLIMGCKLNISETVLREEQFLNSAVMLLPLLRADHAQAVSDVKRFVESLSRRRLPSDLPGTIWRLSRSAPTLLSMGFQYYVLQRRLRPTLLHGWSDFRGNARRYGSFSLQLQLELAPDPANRVFLTGERDRFGRPRAGLQWKLGTQDLDSGRRAREVYAAGLERARLGTVTRPAKDALLHQELQGTNHYMGTTRMHPDPTRGVVNADSRVHGLKNLYVAGSSVFPTGGYQNCTLTIVALAIRLADHVKRQLRP